MSSGMKSGGMPPRLSARASAAGSTHSTPGAAPAARTPMSRVRAGGRGQGRRDDRAGPLVRELEVVDVAPAPGQEPLVLDAPHRLADSELVHELLRQTGSWGFTGASTTWTSASCPFATASRPRRSAAR